MISVQGVSHRYRGADQDALDQLSLNINKGELFGLLGPNGAGKTTLISLLTGLRKLQAGSIQYGGLDMGTYLDDLRKKIAWVPQEYAFYPSLTVMENLRFFADVREVNRSESNYRINEAIRITGLLKVVDKRAAQFSGGLKRRLNVAISLLGDPDYLFLDEPTVGIDPQSRHFILDAIRDINAAGTTIVYSSHYMEEVESLCDRIAIIDQGSVLMSGSLQQLLACERTNVATIVLQQPLPLTVTFPDTVEVSADRLSLGAHFPDQQAMLNLLQVLANDNIEINRLDLGSGNLEQLFLRLTHRSLRD